MRIQGANDAPTVAQKVRVRRSFATNSLPTIAHPRLRWELPWMLSNNMLEFPVRIVDMTKCAATGQDLRKRSSIILLNDDLIFNVAV